MTKIRNPPPMPAHVARQPAQSMSSTAITGKTAGPTAYPMAPSPMALPRWAPKWRAMLVTAVWTMSQSPIRRTRKIPTPTAMSDADDANRKLPAANPTHRETL